VLIAYKVIKLVGSQTILCGIYLRSATVWISYLGLKKKLHTIVLD
jgi:hypothetical protein